MQQINDHSIASADVVSIYRSSLVDLIAQATDVLNSLEELHEADEVVESIYKDLDYYHSIDKVEFDGEYGPDLDSNFTVDDLLEIGASAYEIKKLGCLAQFHQHPNAQSGEVSVKSFIGIWLVCCV